MATVTYRLGEVEGTPDYLIPLHLAIPVFKAAEARDGLDFHGRALPLLAAREFCVSAEQLGEDFSRLRGNTHPFPFQVHASFEGVAREDLAQMSSYDVEDRARPQLQRIVADLTAARRARHRRHFGDIVVCGVLPRLHAFGEDSEPLPFAEALACLSDRTFAVSYYLLFDQRGFDAWTRHAEESPEEHDEMLAGLERNCFF